MKLDNISLIDIAYCEPDKFLTTDEMESQMSELYHKLKLPVGRIEMQTGIKSRGVFQDKLPSDIATKAAKELLAQGEVKVSEIDLLIHASVCRDFLEPSTASVIHSNLQLRADCQSFDLSNACLGVMNAINVAASMIQSGQIKTALIVTGENATPLIQSTLNKLNADESITRKTIKKYFANFTIGSAGVALVISQKIADKPVFIQSASLSNTAAYKLCQGDGNTSELVMETDSEQLMQEGVALAKKNWTKFCEITNIQDWDHYICHQVGIHHQKFLYQELSLDMNKDYSSYPTYGNTGSAALPLTLALAIKNQNIFKKNDHIALLGIGSGLHTIMTGLRWN